MSLGRERLAELAAVVCSACGCSDERIAEVVGEYSRSAADKFARGEIVVSERQRGAIERLVATLEPTL